MLIFRLICLSFLSGYLYFLGGEKKTGKYIKHQKIVRRIGCALISLYIIWLLKIAIPWYIYVATAGLTYFALSTYWDRWGSDGVEWYEWALTGFGYSICTFLIPIHTGLWLGFVVRTLFLTLIISLWSEHFDDVFIEAGGRGLFFAVTLPLLVI